jgi:hypothetical protein
VLRKAAKNQGLCPGDLSDVGYAAHLDCSCLHLVGLPSQVVRRIDAKHQGGIVRWMLAYSI